MDISVIIVNYNTAGRLKNCLDSILDYTKDLEFEIIVVDNNSPNRDIENFKSKYPCVNFYLRNVNDGFGAGCNYGSKFAKGKYLTFVNSDIIFKNNVLFEFKNFLDVNLDAACCSGLLEDFRGKLIYSYNYFSDIKWEFMEAYRIGVQKKINKLLSGDKIIKGTPFEIDWALGALLFLRNDAFKKVNGFDETFFLYCEDNDLQYRIKQCGYKIFCLPFIRVIHEYGGSVKSREGHFIYNLHMNRSRMLYFYKHFNIVKRNIIRFNYLGGNVFRIIILPFRIGNIDFKKKDSLKIYLKNIRIYLSREKSIYEMN